MNRTLTLDELETSAVDLELHLKLKRGKHAEPFAKRDEGRARRKARRARIADKHSYLNS